jgi:hypothetical protein
MAKFANARRAIEELGTVQVRMRVRFLTGRQFGAFLPLHFDPANSRGAPWQFSCVLPNLHIGRWSVA